MSKVDDIVRQHQVEILNSMKKRRDLLDKGIASLEQAIEHPIPPLNIDIEAIKEEARKDIEFLEKCEKVRKGEWIDS
jgi:hypothetical protein